MKYQGYFDGSITVNLGGDMGIGGLVYEVTESGKEKVFEFSEKLPKEQFPNGTSCNVAEALALNKLLSFFILENIHHKQIEIFGDSQVVINRVNKKKKGGKGIFIPYMDDTIDMAEQFGNIRFKWISRDFNTEADEFSR